MFQHSICLQINQDIQIYNRRGEVTALTEASLQLLLTPPPLPTSGCTSTVICSGEEGVSAHNTHAVNNVCSSLPEVVD